MTTRVTEIEIKHFCMIDKAIVQLKAGIEEFY